MVYANTNGMILKVLIADTTSMIYNGTELGEIDVKTEQITYPYYHITSTNYYWNNGDITGVISGGDTSTYDYDLSRNGQPGDPFRISAFMVYGRPLIRTIHLPKDLMHKGAWTEQYAYEFDGQGRISRLMRIGNNNGVTTDDTTVYNYKYY